MVSDDFATERERDKIREYARLVARGWYKIVVIALLCGCVTVAFGFMQTPKYVSAASIYVTTASEDDTQAAYQGTLASQQKVASYMKLATSESVLERASTKLGRGTSVQKLRDMLKTSTTPNTVMFEVAAKDSDPVFAAAVANAVSDSLVDYVGEIEVPNSGGRALAKLTVVSPAVVPTSPAEPNIARNSLYAFAVGIILGVAFVLAERAFNGRISSISDVEGSVREIPVLSAVPNDSDLSHSRSIAFDQSGSSASAEAYRRIRSNLVYASVDSPATTLAITSFDAGDGKTTTAINLAIAFAELGRRVVLVDGDFRRPKVSDCLGLSGSIGFTNAILKPSDFADYVQASNIEGLDVLASGEVPPNPAELLGSDSAGLVLGQLRGSYDFVIVDTAPLGPVSDVLVLTPTVDAFVLVVKAGRTRVRDLTAAARGLRAVGGRIAGVVLNAAVEDVEAYGSYTYRHSHPVHPEVPLS